MRHAALLILLSSLAFAACTPMPQKSGEQPLSPEEIRMRAIEAKLAEVGRRTAAVENKDDSATTDELRRLQGQIEQLRFDMDTADRRNKDLNTDLDRRVAKLESREVQAQAAAAAAVGGPTPPFASMPANPESVAPQGYGIPNPAAVVQSATSGAEEEAAYLRAFDYLKAGKYDNAIVSFRAVLEKWPRGSYSDNSWYWLGESQYVKRQYQPALTAFNTLVERFPASPKVPDALFKSGLAQNELGQTEAAKVVWKRVVKDYPNSNAAGLARQRLAQSR